MDVGVAEVVQSGCGKFGTATIVIAYNYMGILEWHGTFNDVFDASSRN